MVVDIKLVPSVGDWKLPHVPCRFKTEKGHQIRIDGANERYWSDIGGYVIRLAWGGKSFKRMKEAWEEICASADLDPYAETTKVLVQQAVNEAAVRKPSIAVAALAKPPPSDPALPAPGGDDVGVAPPGEGVAAEPELKIVDVKYDFDPKADDMADLPPLPAIDATVLVPLSYKRIRDKVMGSCRYRCPLNPSWIDARPST